MKKNLLFAMLMVLATTLMAQSINDPFFQHVSYRGAFGTNDWTMGWSNFDPQNTVYPAATVTVEAGNITTNTTWTKNNVYLLNGFVYVKAGATLTIEAGTVIRGDKANKGALIVEKGAKIIAEGTVAEPIVFTSNQAAGSRAEGDWGGILLLGNAKTNVPGNNVLIEGGVNSYYGGEDNADNSGVLKFIRLEFPGIALEPGNEINGLTMGGVGSGTTIDYVQVSYSGDDSYEWFGGSVNAKHLIAYSGIDDDFDTDYGYNGMVQFAVSLRNPDMADVAGTSNSFESDNDGTGSYNGPMTTAIFSNVSSFGPRVNASSTYDSHFGSAMDIKKNSRLQIYNTIAAGWKTGVKIENKSDLGAIADSLKVRNSLISGMVSNFAVSSTTTWSSATDVETWYNTVSFGNEINADNANLTLVDAFNFTAPNFLPTAGSALLSGSSWSPTLVGVGVKEVVANSFKAYASNNQIVVEIEAENVAVELFNMNGQLVTKLYNGSVIDGKIIIDNSNVNAGVYLIKLTADNAIKTAKLVLR